MENTTIAPLGELWRKTFYSPIVRSLALDEKTDLASRDLLYSFLAKSDLGLFPKVSDILTDKVTIIFGAGPSLQADIEGLSKFISESGPIIIAADGAAEALVQENFFPDIIVSDLDSCSVKTLKQCSENGFLFIHSHGDNQDLLRKIVPLIPENRFGTTQVSSRLPVVNFGGFTDGDRACYVTSFFNPSRIVIGGMDFGTEEGEFSKNRYSKAINPSRATKLEWGKRSLEFLVPRCPSIRFQNVTKNGVEIEGVPIVSYSSIT